MKNDLIDFLNRIPWAEKKLLEQYFGPDRLSPLLQKSSGKIESVMSADGRTYYSCSPANCRLLPGVLRREMVRKYAVDRFGYAIFDSAESPCFNADFRFFDSERNIWIRIWGDMGSVSPECLLIFRNPPVTGEGLLDIILTCQGSERASFLELQTELAWKPAMAGCVEIVEAESGLTRTITAEPAAKTSGHAYVPEAERYPGLSTGQIFGFNDTKKRKITIQEIRSTELCVLSSKLTPNDYSLMRFIACNPFLNEKEIGLLFGGDSCPADSYFRTAHEYDVIQETRSRVDELRRLDLLKRISKGTMGDTYIPTWKCIDLLAAYHGTIPLYLNKYSQWPEEIFKQNSFEDQRHLLPDKYPFFDSHCHYRQRWAVARPEHQKLLQDFCAALLCGARSLKSIRRVNVEVGGVIVLNLSNDKRGFPSKIESDPVLNLVLPMKDQYPYEEERRLFYVALTRTRNKVYLLTDANRPSEFVDEIKNYSDVIYRKDITAGIQRPPTCPKCGRSLILKKSDGKTPFWACPGFPECNHTQKVL